MAVKITTNIGTDLGITNEAYVRISDYNLSKNGVGANFRLEIFQSQEDVAESGGSTYTGRTARNQQIGETLYVSFWKTVETEVTRTRPVMSAGTSGSAGSGPEMEEYQETITTQEIDFSAAEATNIFAFGYSELKKKLKELFGDSNVVDC